MRNTPIIALLLASLFVISPLNAQRKKDVANKEFSLDALKFRNIGPAFLSGRIADIAIDPNNENLWYVAVGSGGVWKTNNAGTTWKPLFDEQNSYSTGLCDY